TAEQRSDEKDYGRADEQRREILGPSRTARERERGAEREIELRDRPSNFCEQGVE
ncbi:hypothetical protein A2U01_0118138, partial [Trifolium medium]|nr:hypothetical protein [Trifolium medium]